MGMGILFKQGMATSQNGLLLRHPVKASTIRIHKEKYQIS